jgi:hypothetical protein
MRECKLGEGIVNWVELLSRHWGLARKDFRRSKLKASTYAECRNTYKPPGAARSGEYLLERLKLSHPYRPIHRQHLHLFSTAATFRPFNLSPSRLFSLFLLAWGQSKCLKQSPAQDFPSLLGTRMGTTSIRPPHGRSPLS